MKTNLNSNDFAFIMSELGFQHINGFMGSVWSFHYEATHVLIMCDGIRSMTTLKVGQKPV